MRSDVRGADRSAMDTLTAFGFFPVTAMLVRCILAFAGACALGSIYGFLQGAWPFGVIEAIWKLSGDGELDSYRARQRARKPTREAPEGGRGYTCVGEAAEGGGGYTCVGNAWAGDGSRRLPSKLKPLAAVPNSCCDILEP